MAGHRLNGKLLGFKFGAWEGGHRVPFIARWPGKIPAGSVSNQLVSNIDLLATLAEITDQPLGKDEGPDSYNVLEALTGSPKEQIRDHLVLSPARKANMAVRKGKWIYINAQGSGGFSGKMETVYERGGPGSLLMTGYKNSDIENGRYKADAPPAQLYDLESDPYQTTNLYRKYPDKVRELQALLQHSQEVARTAPN